MNSRFESPTIETGKMSKTMSAVALASSARRDAAGFRTADAPGQPARRDDTAQSDAGQQDDRELDVQNRDIGKVSDLVVDRDGRIADVVIDVGSFLGMGGKNVAVRLNELKTDNNRLTLDVTKERLQQMANYRLENRSTGAGSSTLPVTGGRAGSGR